MILERCSYCEPVLPHRAPGPMCGRHASLFYVLDSGPGARVVGRCGMHKRSGLLRLCRSFREVGLEEARWTEVHCA